MNFPFFQLAIFITFISYILVLGIQKETINNIIKFENTNGDIYLNQDINKNILVFGTTLSNGVDRIFYGLSYSTEKYIFKDNNDNYIPYITVNIGRTEKKEIPNAEMVIHSLYDKFYIILIGTDDSYIEILDNLNNFNAYLQNEILFRDTINKGRSSLLFSSSDSSLIYVSSSTTRNDTSKYFINFHQFSISSTSNTINLKFNNQYNEIKGEYMSCFVAEIYCISCFYLDKDNNYKISFIKISETNSLLGEYNLDTFTKFGNEFYFI